MLISWTNERNWWEVGREWRNGEENSQKKTKSAVSLVPLGPVLFSHPLSLGKFSPLKRGWNIPDGSQCNKLQEASSLCLQAFWERNVKASWVSVSGKEGIPGAVMWGRYSPSPHLNVQKSVRIYIFALKILIAFIYLCGREHASCGTHVRSETNL